MKVKITNGSGYLWYKDFVGRIIEVAVDAGGVTATGSAIYYIDIGKCDEDIQTALNKWNAIAEVSGVGRIYEEDCEVIKEDEPLKVGDVVKFTASRYEYYAPDITVTKLYRESSGEYNVLDGIYYNKVTGQYASIIGVFVDAVEKVQ